MLGHVQSRHLSRGKYLTWTSSLAYWAFYQERSQVNQLFKIFKKFFFTKSDSRFSSGDFACLHLRQPLEKLRKHRQVGPSERGPDSVGLGRNWGTDFKYWQP